MSQDYLYDRPDAFDGGLQGAAPDGGERARASFPESPGRWFTTRRIRRTREVEATIDVNTIHTRDEQRDAHLKSADFFDVEKYPTITFVSTKVAKAGDGEWKVTGDLTIHGVTKQVVLDVEGPAPEVKDPWGNVKSGVSATTKINRTDFGLVWNAALETGGVLVGEEVSSDRSKWNCFGSKQRRRRFRWGRRLFG